MKTNDLMNSDRPLSAKVIGHSVARLEDLPLVTGRGRFAADVSFPNQVHMRVVRSSYAHGRIASIDVSEARAVPGVFAVWTFEDVADVAPVGFREGPIAALAPYRQPVLAKEWVRYVGEPVAVIFAEDPYIAEDAAELVADRRGRVAGAAGGGWASQRIRAGA